jgi:hypothetical protein
MMRKTIESNRAALLRRVPLLVVIVLALQLTACEAIKSIFKAGVWVGALGVVAVVAGVVYLLGRMRS